MSCGYCIEIKFFKENQLITTEYMVASDLEQMLEEFQVENFDKVVIVGNCTESNYEEEEDEDEAMTSDSVEFMIDSDEDNDM